MTTTVICVFGIVVLFALALNAYSSGNPEMRRFGHIVVLAGVVMTVLLFGGFFHAMWNAYVYRLWE